MTTGSTWKFRPTENGVDVTIVNPDDSTVFAHLTYDEANEVASMLQRAADLHVARHG